jgi:hypothetical protein
MKEEREVGDRRDEERDGATRKEETKRWAERERRGEELREAWRQHHPQQNRSKKERGGK